MMGRRSLSRRAMLKAAGVAVMAPLVQPLHAVSGVLDRLFGSAPEAKPTPPITPNEEFYITSYRSPPSVRLENWRLVVKGLVERPMTLTYGELQARPRVAEIVTLQCVGNPVGGDAISTAEWEGISLRRLLEEAGIASGAYDVVFRAADGYSDSIRIERAMAGDVLVAYRMNGVPLPQAHGFPVRIIVPGIYGMKSVQWLTDIEVVDYDYQGYDQQKGWSDDATVKTMSRIDVPGHGTVLQGRRQIMQGLAFAGTRGVRQVEVSTNGGGTWAPARLDVPLSPYAWVLWSYEWAVAAPGRHSLAVRATEGLGKMQTSFEQDPAPDGASGLHQITVTVET